MSPGHGRENRFDEKIYDRDPTFEWAYDKEFYFTCPEFPYYYQSIKKLLENKDTIVFGYSVDNDIRYLSSSIKKYHLNQISYRANDIQPMIKLYSKHKLQIGGLNGAFENFCGSQTKAGLCPHLSRDDAKMTMMIVKKICKNLEVTAEELIELCPNCHYDSIKYLEAYEARKKEKSHIKSECQAAWCDFYREHLPLLEKAESIGNIVAISSKLKESMEVIINTIDTIKKNNFVAFDGITGSDMLVVLDEDDKNRLLKILKHPYNGKIILYNDFINCRRVA